MNTTTGCFCRPEFEIFTVVFLYKMGCVVQLQPTISLFPALHIPNLAYKGVKCFEHFSADNVFASVSHLTNIFSWPIFFSELLFCSHYTWIPWEEHRSPCWRSSVFKPQPERTSSGSSLLYLKHIVHQCQPSELQGMTAGFQFLKCILDVGLQQDTPIFCVLRQFKKKAEMTRRLVEWLKRK